MTCRHRLVFWLAVTGLVAGFAVLAAGAPSRVEPRLGPAIVCERGHVPECKEITAP